VLSLAKFIGGTYSAALTRKARRIGRASRSAPLHNEVQGHAGIRHSL
jgi:hypothetical protein